MNKKNMKKALSDEVLTAVNGGADTGAARCSCNVEPGAAAEDYADTLDRKTDAFGAHDVAGSDTASKKIKPLGREDLKISKII